MMRESTVRRLSIAAAAFLYVAIAASEASEVLEVWAQALGIPGPVFATVVGGIGILALYESVVRLGLSLWARPVRGTWIYESSSGNWGVARIKARGDHLSYEVELYENEDQVLDALDGLPGASRNVFAHAKSRMLRFEDRSLEIVYYIDRSSRGYSTREGLLRLEPTSSPKEMKGYWKSDIEGEQPRRGELDFWREDQFRAYVTVNNQARVEEEGGGS